MKGGSIPRIYGPNLEWAGDPAQVKMARRVEKKKN